MQRIEIDSDKLKDMHNRKIPTEDMAREFGCSVSLIHRKLKSLGLNRRCGELKDWQEKYPDSKVIELYQEHRSTPKVARIIGCTSKTVWNVLERNQISRRGHSGSDHSGWKGGRIQDSKGYIRIYKPDHPHAVSNYVPEHRLVMEARIGRFLDPQEEVHHRDQNTSNNDIDNLELCANSSEHMKKHHACNSRIQHILKVRKERSDKMVADVRPILDKLVNQQRHSPKVVAQLSGLPIPFLGSWCRRAGVDRLQGKRPVQPVTQETLDLALQLYSILCPLVRGAKKCKPVDADLIET